MNESLSTAATFANAAQAHFFADRLRDAGLFAVVEDEHVVTTDFLLAGAVGGIKVQVRESELERAREILATPHPKLEDQIPWEEFPGEEHSEVESQSNKVDGAASEVEEPPPTVAEEYVDRAFRSAILGLFFFIFPILTIGSILLLRRAHLEPGKLPERAMPRYYTAVILDAVVLCLAVWIWAQIVGQ
jgi:hypothetical protein